MECISSVTYSPNINCGLTTPFKGKRGIRQGDTMSPYLFVLAMEYLQTEFMQLTKMKDFKFHHRCKKLGLQANADKSFVFIAGVSIWKKEEILQELGLPEGSLPFKYLGVPLDSKKLSIAQCWPLVEKSEVEWVSKNAKRRNGQCAIVTCVFGMLVNAIWRERNKLRFQMARTRASSSANQQLDPPAATPTRGKG
ncbi:uncharacterized protein [Nicotiana sylvestris]|uniref:uncharacterized protein n=1 Tax=Nicotiana sylvestris TaxID=4096 RepID=UPI00388CCF53